MLKTVKDLKTVNNHVCEWQFSSSSYIYFTSPHTPNLIFAFQIFGLQYIYIYINRSMCDISTPKLYEISPDFPLPAVPNIIIFASIVEFLVYNWASMLEI